MNDFVQTYTEKVTQGELTADPAQTAVLPEFERIQKTLSLPVKRGWFSKPPPPPVPRILRQSNIYLPPLSMTAQ